MFSVDAVFFLNIFDPCLIKSMDMDPLDIGPTMGRNGDDDMQ
jgi:hypothetical protein